MSVLALGVGLAAMNEDIRRYVTSMFGRSASAELGDAGWRIEEAGRLVLQAVSEQSIEHAPLMIFAVAAGVLLLFMLRV
jgi:hypothetical protein